MIVKKYTGDNMEELLYRAQKDLGKDFVIIKAVSPERKKGLLKLFGKQKYVLVASDVKMASQFTPPPKKNDVPEMPAVPVKETVPANLIEKSYKAQPAARQASCQAGLPGTCAATHETLNEVRDMLADIYAKTRIKSAPEELLDAYVTLINNCVSEKLSQNIIAKLQRKLSPEQLANKSTVSQALKLAVKTQLKDVSPIKLKNGKTNIIAFIGPTGVGKTTTIAKIASDLALFQHRKTGVITTDTLRIGAADQLQQIVEIIKLPFAKVEPEDPKSVRESIRKMSFADVILVDTAGRSPMDNTRMSELQRTLEVINPDETHLVLSMTTNVQTIEEQIKRFSAYKYDKIILTKLDETTKFGLILEVLSRVKTSLSYITTGQVIPCDIETPDVEKLTRLIIGEQTSARPS